MSWADAGVNDIKEHRWFLAFDWDGLLKKKKQPPFIPEVRSEGDITNFSSYPDSPEEPKSIPQKDDPFYTW